MHCINPVYLLNIRTFGQFMGSTTGMTGISIWRTWRRRVDIVPTPARSIPGLNFTSSATITGPAGGFVLKGQFSKISFFNRLDEFLEGFKSPNIFLIISFFIVGSQFIPASNNEV